MGRLAGFRYRDVAIKLGRLGMERDRRARGSHEVWIHRVTERKVVIPKHAGDIAEGTLRSILRDADIDVDDFLNA